ncbi:hypothetical protein EV2_020246 [Malus domestica]
MHYGSAGGCPLVYLSSPELLLALPNLGRKLDPIGDVLLARARKGARAGVTGAGCLERVGPVQSTNKLGCVCCTGLSRIGLALGTKLDWTEVNAKPREDDDEPEEGEIVGNQDSESSKPSKGIAPQSHALEHSWTFWFNSPAAKFAKSKQEDWGSSIGPIYTFITVEEFWRTLAGRRKKPRTHRRVLREEEEAGLSKSHGLGSASLRTFKMASSPHESPLVPLNLVPSPIKHGTVVQSSPVPPKEVKQTPP